MPFMPSATKGAPEGDFKYVLFAGYRTGPDWPNKYVLYHTQVQSVSLDWPDWLPYIDVKTHAPAVAPLHTRWPIQVEREPGKPPRTAPGARVSAIFTNDKAVRDVVFRKGWVDVSDIYRRALEAHRAAQAAPAPKPVQPSAVETMTEIAARVLPSRRRAAPAT